MPKYEKAIVSHVLQIAKESDDVEFLENNIFNPFFYKNIVVPPLFAFLHK